MKKVKVVLIASLLVLVVLAALYIFSKPPAQGDDGTLSLREQYQQEQVRKDGGE